jgi:putative methionine-R-sulfoxide reductase with GAF domain
VGKIVSEGKKPIRDEQTLAKVLEAAYVLQEYNREMQKKEPGSKVTKDSVLADHLAGKNQPISSSSAKRSPEGSASQTADSSFTLAQIVEIQYQIQAEHLELTGVMSLIVERMTQIAGNSAAIGILEGKNVQYRAAAGVMALPPGTQVPMEKALCFECLRTAAVLRCADVNTELLLDGNECRRRGIQSMIAVPIFHEGRVAGSLELYFSHPQGFTEDDVHTCQLMAGLVSEARARNEKVDWKKSVATEHAVMLEALEKLKPNLAGLADKPADRDSSAPSRTSSMANSASTVACVKCGHELVGAEQFCGNCGLPRSSDDYDAHNLQSTIATLWHMQEAMKKAPTATPTNGAVIYQESQKNRIHAVESVANSPKEHGVEPRVSASLLHDQKAAAPEVPDEQVSVELADSSLVDLEGPPLRIPDEKADALAPTALAKPERPAPWSSAATARDFFEQLAAAKNPGAWAKFWNTRRGDVYLAIAVGLVVGVIWWGIRSSHSTSTTGNPAASAAHRKAAPDADLSLFDRILVKLGLAEAPDPPQYKGNPRTKVWVDLQTALYYCPGADLYGKTPKGKFSSQRDAQLDQFEPAYRKACD